jgi:putative two-component system response regulator
VDGLGTHFDPDTIDAFCAVAHEFHAIAERFADTDEDLAQKAAILASMTQPEQVVRQ